MGAGAAAWLLIAAAFVASNLPWLSDRILLFLPAPGGRKAAWVRFLEWLLLYLLTGVFALGLEMKLTGEPHAQDWEFYVVTFFLFLVFALPGFIYRYEFQRHRRR